MPFTIEQRGFDEQGQRLRFITDGLDNLDPVFDRTRLRPRSDVARQYRRRAPTIAGKPVRPIAQKPSVAPPCATAA